MNLQYSISYEIFSSIFFCCVSDRIDLRRIALRGARLRTSCRGLAFGTTYRGALNASWEIDLFVRVRRQHGSARADADATAANFESVRLALTAEVAANYFSLRGLTSEISLVAHGVELRRDVPDIAAAERALAAANARIGVAKAAFFPAISLTGSAGFASGDIDRLFNADSRIWSIGPSLYLPIFQGGRNKANLERSRAAYEGAVAVYRQRVLVAFREVQDALTASRFLTEQSVAQERALVSARRSNELARKRYDSGLVNLLEVIDTQRTVLTTERASTQLAVQRLAVSVALIKAVGGDLAGQTKTVAVIP